jgi:lipopolysaccharide transport system permease protein
MDDKTMTAGGDRPVAGTAERQASSKLGRPDDRPLKAPHDRDIVNITPRSGLDRGYLHDLWTARALIKVLVWRDLRVRYKQTILGVGWVILQPVMTALLYSLLFGYIARMPSEGVPYPIFLLIALLPWLFISRLVSDGSTSVAANSGLVGKIYFPRLVLPLAVTGSLLVDLLAGFAVALVAMALFGYFPGVRILVLPLIVVFAAATGLSIALLLAPLDVNYRDVRVITPFAIQVVMFVSPILYSASVVPEKLRFIFDINPVAVIANSVRWSLLGHGTLPGAGTIVISVGLVAALLAAGALLFVRAETGFADRI